MEEEKREEEKREEEKLNKLFLIQFFHLLKSENTINTINTIIINNNGIIYDLKTFRPILAGNFETIRCFERGTLSLTFTNITIEIISKDINFHTFIEKLQEIFNTFYPSVEVPSKPSIPSLQELTKNIIKQHDYSEGSLLLTQIPTRVLNDYYQLIKEHDYSDDYSVNESLKGMIEKGGKRYAQSKFKVPKSLRKTRKSSKSRKLK